MERAGMASAAAMRVPAADAARGERIGTLWSRRTREPSRVPGMVLAPTSSMSIQAPRAAVAAVLVMGSVLACSRPSAQPGVVGPALGESTAPGPGDPNALPPDAGPPDVVVGRLHDTRPSGPVPGPMPDPSVGSAAPVAAPATPGVVALPGVGTPAAAPAATGTASGVGAAGPNGP